MLSISLSQKRHIIETYVSDALQIEVDALTLSELLDDYAIAYEELDEGQVDELLIAISEELDFARDCWINAI